MPNIVASAVAIDGVVVAALVALEQGAPSLDPHDVRPRFMTALARFLATDAAEGIEQSRVGVSVSVAARELRAHPLVLASNGAHRRIIACERAHPYVVRG